MRSRVAFVSLTPFFGGGEIYYERLGALLSGDLEIYALVASPELAERLRQSTAEVQLIPRDVRNSALRRFLYARRELRKLIVERQISTVHLNGQAEANLVSLCRSLRVPCVITRHSDLRLRTNPLKRLLYKWNAARADYVICVARHLVALHAPFVAGNKLYFVPHWFLPTPRPAGADHDPFTVLYLGRIQQEKGILELIEAAKGLRDIQFLIAGEGDLRRDLERGSSENVRFLGFQQDVGSLFSRCDILVHPSHFEGSPLVVLEAMAAGVPCLLSDITALREVSGNGQCADLYPCGDSHALAQRLLALRADPGRREHLAARALEMVQHLHSPEGVRRRYLELLVPQAQT